MSDITKVPKYVRLAESIRLQVRTGALKPGDQLPSYAQVQAEYGIGQSTLERVYRLLEQESLIVRTPKLGTFVSEPKKRGRANVIGLIAGEQFTTNPYYSKMFHGIREVAESEKVELLILHKESIVNWEKTDGMILWQLPTMKFAPAMPIVALMNNIPGIPNVIIDDYAAMKTAIAHLLELGHRRIAFLTLGVSQDHDEISEWRLRGYRDGLREAGIEPAHEWQRPLRELWGLAGNFMDMGYHRMKSWIDEDWRSQGCTALLAQNDETAIGAICALHEAGIEVPREVSVMGFDGLDVAAYMRPRLTTIVIPLHEVGAEATRLLLRRIETDSLETSLCPDDAPSLIMPTTLRVAESTAPPLGG